MAKRTQTLRPFFSFYGSKWRAAPKYPKPKHGRIVEPFAGSAGYSLRYPDREVVLVDVDPTIAGIWDYLIKASEKEILNIPDVPPHGSVKDLKIGQEAKWLVGFWVNRASSAPRFKPSKWMRENKHPRCFWGRSVRQRIAGQLKFIRHWKVRNSSYSKIKVRKSTWFIDPPYERAGAHYIAGSNQIDYEDLSSWCRAREGQVIVCENSGAVWLPFKRFSEEKSMVTGRASYENRKSKEVCWVCG